MYKYSIHHFYDKFVSFHRNKWRQNQRAIDVMAEEVLAEDIGLSQEAADLLKANDKEFDYIVWETNTLAKVSLMPIVNRFPDYGAIIDSNLVEIWDYLMTIAMTGVVLHSEGMLSNPQVRHEVNISLSRLWQMDIDLFDDYYKYTKLQTKKTTAPWSDVSAMWVAGVLRIEGRATTALMSHAKKINFANRLSTFMNISFGSTEVGFPHYFGTMALEVEKNIGIDMGLGTQDTEKDLSKKMSIIAHIFKSFAQNTVELIVEKQ